MILNLDSFVAILVVIKLKFFPIEASSTGLSTDGYFERSSSCGDISTLLSHSCAFPVPAGKSAFGPMCLFYCSKNPHCLGLVFDLDSHQVVCYQLQTCKHKWHDPDCALSLDKRLPMMRRPCLNGGILVNKDGLICKCKDGWIGHFCERRATHCKELYGYNYPTSAIVVKINYKSKLMRMECRVKGDNYQTGLFANNGTTNKSRSWNDYKNGFYDDENNYFVGLENIKSLIEDERNSLDTQMKQTFIVNSDGKSVFGTCTYHGFALNDESKGYAYSYDKADCFNTGAASRKCFQNKDGGIPFSTPDNDNDRDLKRNCAALSQAGWWFDTCEKPIKCNLLGWRAEVLPLPLTHAHFTLNGVDVDSDSFKTDWSRMQFVLLTRF